MTRGSQHLTRIVFVILFSAFAILTSFAKKPISIQYGIVAGTGISGASFLNTDSKASNSFGDNSTITPVFNAGIFASIPLRSFFVLQPHLLYSQKGIQSKDWYYNSHADFKLVSSYFEIPVQFQYRYCYSNCALIGFVEPFVGFCAINHLKYYTTIGDTVVDRNEVVTCNDEGIVPFEYGAGIGASMQINNIVVSIKYIRNLNYIGNNDAHDNTGINQSLKNGKYYGVDLSVGYLF